MSREDREKWDARYADSAVEENLEPDPFLPNILERLPTSGHALDLAGGSGRHAVFLAKLGLDVTLVDISTRGLAQADHHPGLGQGPGGHLFRSAQYPA